MFKSGTSVPERLKNLKGLYCDMRVFFTGLYFSKAMDTLITRGERLKMLIISRKKDEKIILADDIEITILEVGRNRVRFGIKAPKSVPIHTRLKTSPVPGQTSGQIIEMEPKRSPLEGLPAASGLTRHQ